MTDELDVTSNIKHYGTPHKSGRYPWGSGEDSNQRNKSFLDYVDSLKKKGLSEVDIAKGMSISTTELRAKKSIAKNEYGKAQQMMAVRLKEKGTSNVAIGERMGLNESSVRALLNPIAQEKTDQLHVIANILKDQVTTEKYLDVGKGTENHLGISDVKLKVAVAILEEQGYNRYKINIDQVGTSNGQKTRTNVLALPETDIKEVYKNQDRILPISGYSPDQGKTIFAIEKPVNVDSKRIQVKYGPQGGAEKDGVIEVRRGVNDVSLGASKYAQVRIAVDGTHYLKGMAMYADDLPYGIDIRFNTNKEDKGGKLKALKPQKNIDDDPNPFGSIVTQRHYVDADGKTKLSAMNIVNEEGDWDKWSKNLSSQVLSKQSPALAKRQLDLKYKSKQDEYDEIMSLTNPTIKKKLLESFADDMDSSAVHLKAAALPRQRTQVILPISSINPKEIYAPNFKNGEQVVLVRYPHGGIFEIPELTVNNKQAEAIKSIGGAHDAVGIHSSVAARLSGADFDGDTVLVIPNNAKNIKTQNALAGLKGFEPTAAYPPYEGMRTIDGGTWNIKTQKVDFPPGKTPSGRTKQLKMGDVSNLITDMTVQGAPNSEIVKAVRHSMVVIDAEKHSLNWRQSAKDNSISELKKKYQGASNAGAATLISRSSSQQTVADRKDRTVPNGGRIDPATGRKVYQNIDSSYVNAKGQTVVKTIKSTKMAETDDARTLISDAGTPMEHVYADHANSLKALANTARKSYLSTPSLEYSPSAKKAYDSQVRALKADLNIALKNAPLERKAQLLANATVSAKRAANPDMDKAELKKTKGIALTEARLRAGAKKQRIDITPDKWAAIQAGAISNNFLRQILANADLDQVKQLATPHTTLLMSTTKVARANAMISSGFTKGEIAEQLGVSVSTLNSSLT